MEFEPRALVFQGVRLNQAYTTSLCISNKYTSAVDFSIQPSSTRYTVNPNRVNLSPGQSIVVTVRLFLNHNPSLSEGSNLHEDLIFVKSSYFEHEVSVKFTLSTKDTAVSSRQSIFLNNTAEEGKTRQSISPSLRNRVAHQSTSASPVPKSKQNVEIPTATILRTVDLEKQLSAKNKTVEHLQSIIKQLESKYPSMQELVRNHVEQERLGFEEKSEKVSEVTIIIYIKFLVSRFLFLVTFVTPFPILKCNKCKFYKKYIICFKIKFSIISLQRQYLHIDRY